MQIHITITGQANTGKTAIAYALERMLKEAGITVTVDDIDGPSEWERNYLSLAKKDLEVSIKTEQEMRKPHNV